MTAEARVLSPLLSGVAEERELIVKYADLYQGDTLARAALAQSVFWVAGCCMVQRRPVGRGTDIRRGISVWGSAVSLAAEAIKQMKPQDPGLFMVAYATEISRQLQGPDLLRLVAVHASMEEREPLIPRWQAAEEYSSLLGRGVLKHAAELETLSNERKI